MKKKITNVVIVLVVSFIMYIIGGKTASDGINPFFETEKPDTVMATNVVVFHDVIKDTVVVNEDIKWIIKTDTLVDTTYIDSIKTIHVTEAVEKQPEPFVLSFSDNSNKFVNIFGNYWFPHNNIEFYYVNKYKAENWYGRVYITGGMMGVKPAIGLSWCNRRIVVNTMYAEKRMGVSVGYRIL